MLKRLKKTLTRKSGMTLVELMVALMLVVLVMTLISTFFGFIARFYRNSDDLSARQDQARLIVNGLRNSLDTSLDLSILSSAPPAEAVPAGYAAIYVANGRLARRAPDGTVEYVFSNVAFDTLSVAFTQSGPSLLSVSVYIGGELLAQTDILLENCEIPPASGSAVLYLPVS